MNPLGWIIAVLLAGVLALGGAEYARLVEKYQRLAASEARYAALVVACANTGDFTLDGEWLIRCRRRKIED